MCFKTTQIYDKNQVEISDSEQKSLNLKGLNSYFLCPKSEIAQSDSKNIEFNLKKHISRKNLVNIDVCPLCEARLHSHGKRLRSFKDESSGKTYYIYVRRKYCPNCKTSWTVLPRFLQPYKIIIVSIIYLVIKNYIKDKAKGKIKDSTVCKGTQQRWYLQFYQAAIAYPNIREEHLLTLLEGLFSRSFLAPSKGLSFFQDADLFV